MFHSEKGWGLNTKRTYKSGRLSLSGWVAIALLATALFVLLSGSALAEETYSISGRIVDVDTGNAISNTANVYLRVCDPTTGKDSGIQYFPNSEGYFVISGLAPGFYKVFASANDYVGEWSDGLDMQYHPWGQGVTPVDITSGDQTGVEFALQLGRSITGNIVDADTGDPIANVDLQLCDADGRWSRGVGGLTDSNGDYTISGLLPLQYDVRTCVEQGYINQALPADVTQGNQAGIDFALTRGCSISGRVTDALTTLPIPDVTIALYDATDMKLVEAFSADSDARYSTQALPPGSYKVRTGDGQGYINRWHSGAVCQTDPEGTQVAALTLGDADITGINFALTRGQVISGRVTDALTTQPISDVNVALYDATDRKLVEAISTDSDGRYSTQGLLPGSYVARAWNEQGYVNEWYGGIHDFDGAGATRIDITPDSGAVADFALVLGNRIFGRVTDASGGQGIAGVVLVVFDTVPHRICVAVTDSTGDYSTEALIPEQYLVIRSVNTQGYADQWYRGVSTQGNPEGTGAEVLDLSLGDAGGKDFSLRPLSTPPSGLAVSDHPADNGRALDLSWDSGLSPLGYQLLRGTAPGDYDYQVDLGDLNTYVDTNLTPGVTYYYALRAHYWEPYSGDLWSDLSEETSAAPVDDGTGAEVVWVPAGQGVTVEAGGVTLTFDEVTVPGALTVGPAPQNGEPAPDFQFLSGGWSIDPGTVSFTVKVTITFPYDPLALPPGVNEADLTIWHFEDGGWKDVTLPPVDSSGHLIKALVTSLSPFALAAPAQTPFLGVALYSGADATLSGSCRVESPLVAGQPSAASYVDGSLKTSGSADLSHTVLYVKANGALVPPLGQFMPDSLVTSLTLASQAAQQAGTVYNGLSYGGNGSATLTQPITVSGDLAISGSGTYDFASVYVTGNVTISGSPTVSFESLRVGGKLTVGGSGVSYWGPTYVAGNTSLSGSGRWYASLLVTAGAFKAGGSLVMGGDGLDGHARPVMVLLVGPAKQTTLSGSATFYGLLYNRTGGFTQSGSTIIWGSVLAGGSYSASGDCRVEYEEDVLSKLD